MKPHLCLVPFCFQVFFCYYKKLAGMTGTAMPAAAEFFELYGLQVILCGHVLGMFCPNTLACINQVVQVPTNQPSARKDQTSMIFFNFSAKYQYLCNVVQRCWNLQRPVLIGTTSVKESETIMLMLQQLTPKQYHHQLTAVQLLNATPEKVGTLLLGRINK